MKIAENKITLLSIFVGIIGIAVTAFTYIFPNKSEQYPIVAAQQAKPAIQSAKLTISAVGSNVTIKESLSNTPYSGGHITSTGSSQTIYVPKGQLIYVNLSGTGTQLNLANSIAGQVQVNNTGTGANVSVF